MTGNGSDPDPEEEIIWEEPQWEPTQKDPLDLWSGLPTDEWRHPVMTERCAGYLTFEEKWLVRSVVEALAVYLSDSGPKTRRSTRPRLRTPPGRRSLPTRTATRGWTPMTVPAINL